MNASRNGKTGGIKRSAEGAGYFFRSTGYPGKNFSKMLKQEDSERMQGEVAECIELSRKGYRISSRARKAF